MVFWLYIAFSFLIELLLRSYLIAIGGKAWRIHIQPLVVQFWFLMMRLWLHMWGICFLERMWTLKWWEESLPKALLLTPCYVCNHESPNNSVHIFSFVKHCSRSLVFLILRLQQLSWLFHCSFSTCCTFSADGYFSWLYCQYIIAFGIFTVVPLYSMEKCFRKLQFGCCIFLGPKDFLVHKNHKKAKTHSVSVQTDMSNERYVYKYGRKHICVLGTVFTSCCSTATKN